MAELLLVTTNEAVPFDSEADDVRSLRQKISAEEMQLESKKKHKTLCLCKYDLICTYVRTYIGKYPHASHNLMYICMYICTYICTYDL